MVGKLERKEMNGFMKLNEIENLKEFLNSFSFKKLPSKVEKINKLKIKNYEIQKSKRIHKIR